MTGSTICLSSELEDGGDGVEFSVVRHGEIVPAFAVRFDAVVYAYVNRCGHMALKLNFVHRDFFDLERRHLICATHGALYAPQSGACRGGPCNGTGLVPLAVKELDGKVTLSDNDAVAVVDEDSP